MTMLTRKGRKAASEMIKHFDRNAVSVDDLAAPLSLIGRLSPAYARIQEVWCNEDLSARPKYKARLERRESAIERRVRAIVATIPATTTGPIGVIFGGDPRGYTIKLHVPDAPRDGNTWGTDGDYGIGE